jgi:hypothetical protein
MLLLLFLFFITVGLAQPRGEATDILEQLSRFTGGDVFLAAGPTAGSNDLWLHLSCNATGSVPSAIALASSLPVRGLFVQDCPLLPTEVAALNATVRSVHLVRPRAAFESAATLPGSLAAMSQLSWLWLEGPTNVTGAWTMAALENLALLDVPDIWRVPERKPTNLTSLLMRAQQGVAAAPPPLRLSAEFLRVPSLIVENVALHPALFEQATFNSSKVLVLRNCSLSGALPPALGSAGGLEVLDLSANNLRGPLFSLQLMRSLETLALSGNPLGGVLLPKTESLRLRTLRLDSCGLSGPLTMLPPNLRVLSARNNALNGTLLALSDLRSLEQLYLDRNAISGTVPTELRRTQLVELNLTFNNLDGNFPDVLRRVDVCDVLAGNLFRFCMPNTDGCCVGAPSGVQLYSSQVFAGVFVFILAVACVSAAALSARRATFVAVLHRKHKI